MVMDLAPHVFSAWASSRRSQVTPGSRPGCRAGWLCVRVCVRPRPFLCSSTGPGHLESESVSFITAWQALRFQLDCK